MKYLNTFIVLILIVVVFIQATCKKNVCNKNSHQYFYLKNLSTRNIVAHLECSINDTILSDAASFQEWNTQKNGILNGDSVSHYFGRQNCAEKEYLNGKICVDYIFDLDTIHKLTWDVVRTTHRGLLAKKNNFFRNTKPK